jgi:hypothetical protein
MWKPMHGLHVFYGTFAVYTFTKISIIKFYSCESPVSGPSPATLWSCRLHV